VNGSADFLLGGAVRHAQGPQGHRTGIEPVLLAACVPARPGQLVLEGGTGSGAGLLCLAQRVPGIGGTGVELAPDQAALAQANIAANGFSGLSVVAGDLMAQHFGQLYDHAFANPPWHAARATVSPDPARKLARQAPAGLFAAWAQALATPLRPRGTLSFVTSAATITACLDAFTRAGCGSHAILPLWPRAGRPAKLVLLQGVRGGRGPTRLLPGLVLHAPEGGYTQQAHAVLYQGVALPI
jgi:tRNA1(Val) A37 N6-methylase TrmN6